LAADQNPDRIKNLARLNKIGEIFGDRVWICTWCSDGAWIKSPSDHECADLPYRRCAGDIYRYDTSIEIFGSPVALPWCR
jgi:hypothetical protein